MKHELIEKLCSFDELRFFVAGDDQYGSQLLNNLVYDEIGSPREPASHSKRVLESIMLFGINQPIVAEKRNGVITVADGHHRAVAAIHLKLTAPILIVVCDCSEERMTTLCEETLALCRQEHEKTKAAGWTWSPASVVKPQ